MIFDCFHLVGECLGELFTCDGNCGCLFHVKCAGIVGSGGQYCLPEGEWFCTSCTLETESYGKDFDDSSYCLRSRVSLSKRKIRQNSRSPDIEELDVDDLDIGAKGQGIHGVLSRLSSSYHAMRKERNRILAQWQHEKQVFSQLEEKRQTAAQQSESKMLSC